MHNVTITFSINWTAERVKKKEAKIGPLIKSLHTPYKNPIRFVTFCWLLTMSMEVPFFLIHTCQHIDWVCMNVWHTNKRSAARQSNKHWSLSLKLTASHLLRLVIFIHSLSINEWPILICVQARCLIWDISHVTIGHWQCKI